MLCRGCWGRAQEKTRNLPLFSIQSELGRTFCRTIFRAPEAPLSFCDNMTKTPLNCTRTCYYSQFCNRPPQVFYARYHSWFGNKTVNSRHALIGRNELLTGLCLSRFRRGPYISTAVLFSCAGTTPDSIDVSPRFTVLLCEARHDLLTGRTGCLFVCSRVRVCDDSGSTSRPTPVLGSAWRNR